MLSLSILCRPSDGVTSSCIHAPAGHFECSCPIATTGADNAIVGTRCSTKRLVFIGWWLLMRVCAIVLSVAAGAYGIWVVHGKRWLLRLPVRLLSLLLVLLGASDAIFVWAFPNPNSYSAPIYSPNRKMAVRVHEYDASGFGGADTSAELFWAHGLKSKSVFFGEYRSVDAAHVRWKSDSELEVSYRGTAFSCTSAFNVSVRCISQ